MHLSHSLTRWFTLVLLVAVAQSLQGFDAKMYHLRSGAGPEWREPADQTPDAKRLDLRFNARKNSSEATLFIRQDGVKLDWRVELNGQRLGNLFLMEAPLVHTLPVAAGLLRDGENVLSIIPPSASDDIKVGNFQLDSNSRTAAVGQATLKIRVTDGESGAALPSRITIVDAGGALSPVAASANQPLAVRPGVIYSGTGRAEIGVRPGEYILYATRGFEYGLAKSSVTITAGQIREIELKIRREVPTPGYVCSDTHIHTLTHSKHGDATMEERAVTLAGEGIELPIATEHEFLADFSVPAKKMGVAEFQTSVIGCEVTTARGHFNAFPIVAGSAVPDHRILEWPRLMGAIRSTPGVLVVVLNHPRNIHGSFQPFAATNFNAVTGENRRGFEFSFDAIEVANSSALQSDWRSSFSDWLALLNYGYRLTALGSSDCHDVSRYIVGQGRSYIACEDAKPDQIDVQQAGRSVLAGRVLVSMGLLAEMTVNERFGVGDLATGLGDEIQVAVRVLGPSWTSVERVELLANGVTIRNLNVETVPQNSNGSSPVRYDPVKAQIVWRIPRPRHDVHLVAFATGPGVSGPYWAIPRPYQPSSPIWNPPVLGCTNPIWIDADGDGRFTAARGHAQALVRKHDSDMAALFAALADCDEAVAAQAASLLDKAGRTFRDPEFTRLVNGSAPAVRTGFVRYQATLP